MAAAGTLDVQCPECGVVVPIAVETRSTTSRGNVLQLVLDPDYTDAWAHSWTHMID
ncbi:hypothetical protein [Streptomyces sp. NPDC058667]|uniref:hypothetical protein n=1 Tax=Streptomyces sp. NPDC058667 TaxID=3346588 RepID=UPI00364D3BC3